LSEPIQALVTDVVMPDMARPELAARLPSLRVLFMSGYTDRGESVILNDPSAAFIQKPFLPDALARQLRDLLDRSIQRGQDSRI
jgi:two-component system, cell cycle sensor histidine kinase and response regulator CckA